MFDAHDRAFAFFGGACQRGIYDNMKTEVDAIFVGRERRYNRRFQQMCGHYLVEPVACTPASGWEKGQVENQVGLVRERFFTPRRRFKSFAELNAWLEDRCLAHARRAAHPERKDRTIWEVFEEADRPALIAYRGRFDGFHALPASVSKTLLVRFDYSKYSVHAKAAGRPVDVRAYADRIVIRQDGETVADVRTSTNRSIVTQSASDKGRVFAAMIKSVNALVYPRTLRERPESLLGSGIGDGLTSFRASRVGSEESLADTMGDVKNPIAVMLIRIGILNRRIFSTASSSDGYI